MRHVVVVGGGLAGGNVAAGLRDEGYDGDITIVADEPGVPFGRPPLSKTYLRGEESLSAWYVKPPEWYEQSSVTVLRAHAERIDAAGANIALADGPDILCDAVVIASGARARSPSQHALVLRMQPDADAIRARAQPGARAVVAGMSFIGAEVAASLRRLGVEVTAVFPDAGPLARVLGGVAAARMAQIHDEAGVELVPNAKVVEFHADHVVTDAGRRIDCDFAVAGLGVDPVLDLAKSSGIETGNGILVDARCRTNVENVYAAGDVASHDHPLFGRIRVEHYNNAEKQGRYVAKALLGSTEPYDYLHTFWSDQYDHKIEYVGHAREWDEFVVRGDPDGAFIGFYMKDGVVRAVMGLDRGGDPELEPDSEMAACARLIGTRVDAGALIIDG
jgi:3-phenylpropionate/trans-cinnamate dioxygenase ferredoxin reductase subunit